jgi:hypothetical protein
MKRTLILAGLAGFLASVPAVAATISNTDPVPNVTTPVRDGGVGYRWTVEMGGTDRAEIEGVVGAWSWDEDTFPTTARGWTHTSNWVALKLNVPSVVTIRLARKENVPNPAGGLGGNVLYPAFTLYRGWDGDGADNHTYNNRGNVDWAEDLTYLIHHENDGVATSVEITLELEAGEYSIALGGNSPETLREPVQGYGATILTRPIPQPGLTLNGGPVLRTRQPSVVISGRVLAPEKAKSIVVSSGGRREILPVRGAGFTFRAGSIEPGRTVLSFALIDHEGKVADRQRVVIHRETPPAKPLDPGTNPFARPQLPGRFPAWFGFFEGITLPPSPRTIHPR